MNLRKLFFFLLIVGCLASALKSNSNLIDDLTDSQHLDSTLFKFISYCKKDPEKYYSSERGLMLKTIKMLFEQEFSPSKSILKDPSLHEGAEVKDSININLDDFDRGVKFSSYKDLLPSDKDKLLKEDIQFAALLFQHFLKTPSCKKAIKFYTDHFIKFIEDCSDFSKQPINLLNLIKNDQEKLFDFFEQEAFNIENINFMRDKEGNIFGIRINLGRGTLLPNEAIIKYNCSYIFRFNSIKKINCSLKGPSNTKPAIILQEDTGEFLPVDHILDREVQFFPGEEFVFEINLVRANEQKETSVQFKFRIVDQDQSILLNPLKRNEFSLTAIDLNGKEIKHFISDDDLTFNIGNLAGFSETNLSLNQKIFY